MNGSTKSNNDASFSSDKYNPLYYHGPAILVHH